MGNLVNPVSLRLSYNCYWNNAWAINNLSNYSYISMLDYCLFKYVSFMWDRLKWYRKGFIFFGFKLFRVFDTLYINFIIRNQKLYNKLLYSLKPLYKKIKMRLRKRRKYRRKVLVSKPRRLKIKYNVSKLGSDNNKVKKKKKMC